MAKKPLPSPEVLRQLLKYEPETGKLFWKERGPEWFSDTPRRSAAHACALWNSRYGGKEALASIFDGYGYGKLLGTTEMAHRVVWTMCHGRHPRSQIDHIDHNRSNNRLENLREVDQVGNSRNASKSKANRSGITGVSWHRATQKWSAYISDSGKIIHLGLFDAKERAAEARRAAEKEIGFHKNHGT